MIGIFFYGSIYIKYDYYLYYDGKNDNNNLLRLVIPKIDFDRKIYDFSSKLNNVDYNVEMLRSSDIYNNLYFFAGHTGSGDNCYFNRLIELKISDIIYILNNDKKLVYEVNDIYFIRKNGYMEVEFDVIDTVFLITCSDYDRQLIVKGVLIN